MRIYTVLYKERGKTKVASFRNEEEAYNFLSDRKGRVVANKLKMNVDIHIAE